MAAAAVAAIGGIGFLATKLDVGFSEFFREAIVKVGRSVGMQHIRDACLWIVLQVRYAIVEHAHLANGPFVLCASGFWRLCRL